MITIELTEDELTILNFLLRECQFTDEPLKDVEELGDRCPADPYGVLTNIFSKTITAAKLAHYPKSND